MILVGRYSLKPWIRGLAVAPRGAAVVCLTKTFHDARQPEILSAQAVKDLRAALLDCASTGRLSAAIAEHGRSPGTSVTLAAIQCADLADARKIAGDILSPAKKKSTSAVAKGPDLSELLSRVRELHRQVTREAHRRVLGRVRDLLETL